MLCHCSAHKFHLIMLNVMLMCRTVTILLFCFVLCTSEYTLKQSRKAVVTLVQIIMVTVLLEYIDL